MLRVLVYAGLLSSTAWAASSFDELVASKGIPTSLVELKQRYPAVLSVPVEPSRSLQKVREVATFQLDGQRIFVGFSKGNDGPHGGKNTLEVISEDLDARPPRSSFQLFDLETRPPAPLVAEDCEKCHQHGGPIFGRSPWSDVATERAVFFDSAVRDYNAYMQARDACAQFCPAKDFACRADLLRLALGAPAEGRPLEAHDPRVVWARGGTPGSNVSLAEQKALLDSIPRSWIDRVQAMSWPKDGFGYISSTLPDRTFRTDTVGGVKRYSYLGTSRDDDENVFDDDRSGGSVSGEKLDPTAKSLASALTARPLSRAIPKAKSALYLAAVAFPCVGLKPSDADELRRLEPADVARALSEPELRALLADDAWPPRRGALIGALRAARGPRVRPPTAPGNKGGAPTKETHSRGA